MTPLSTDAIRHRLQENLGHLHADIRLSCEQAGRNSQDVTLVAVTKYTPIEVVTELQSLGYGTFGESRPQQLVERAGQLPSDVAWHLIGQLQKNKIRMLLPHVDLIHSVDSLKLLERIDRIAGEENLCPNLLLQVNTSGDASRTGFSPDKLRQDFSSVTQFRHLNLQGLMTMAPNTDDEHQIRASFRSLRELRDELLAANPKQKLEHLSMGMSGDYKIAIAEGATLIRVGSLLFEGCPSLR